MKVQLNPLPSALLESLRSIGYTIETALADIIDNSITAGAGRISVRYLWNNGRPWIAVHDDGKGMDEKELIEAMRLGSKNPNEKRNAEDLGRFGLGMKTASFSQCRLLTVISRKGKSLFGCEWDLDSIALNKSNDWNIRTLAESELTADKTLNALILELFSHGMSGTIVLWRKIDDGHGNHNGYDGENRFSALLDSARKHLELVFHRFLSPALGRKKVAIDFNNTPLEAFDPFGSPIPSRQELTAEKIRIEGEVVTVQPYVLPHQTKAGSVDEYQRLGGEEGYLQNQGFYVYRNHRLIIKATWFRLIPKDELNKLIRVRVDIPNSLDHHWRIDVKKSQASPPELIRLQLKQIIKKISGSGRIVFTNRAAKIRNRQVIPVWRREVVQGRVRYLVNEEHPIVQGLLHELSETKIQCLRACFELINTTFPYDMYYADAANDKTEFDNEGPDLDTVKRVGIQLVRALRSCGFSGDRLREQMRGTEFFNCPPVLFEEILEVRGDLHD
jgi:hypothetical protein